MGTGYRPAANLPEDERADDEEPLGDAIEGLLAEVEVDSVESVREIRQDE